MIKELLKNIEKLIFDDSNFKKLKDIYSNIDKHIFKIIVKDNDELTFSRNLKYFLDPKEQHNIGDRILRSFLDLLILKDEEYYRLNDIHRINIDLLNLIDVEVFREYSIQDYGRLDIFIELNNTLALLIEVKLFSREGDEQTNRYESWALNIGKKYKYILCAFLTPEGLTSQSKIFTSISFSDLLTILSPKKHLQLLNDQNKYLFNNFISWIKELLPMDQNLRNLCRNIYKKYKNELDLIINNIPSLSAFYKDIVNYTNNNYGNEILAHSGSNWVTFSPLEYMKIDKLTESKKYSLPRIEYNCYSENYYFTLVIPAEGKTHDLILKKSNEIFSKKPKDLDLYKNWGKKYIYLSQVETFIPENIIDEWDEKVKFYSEEAIRELNRIKNILTIDFLT